MRATAISFRLRAARFKADPIASADACTMLCSKSPLFVGEQEARPIGHRRGRNDIASPDFQPADDDVVGRERLDG